MIILDSIENIKSRRLDRMLKEIAEGLKVLVRELDMPIMASLS